MRLGPPPHPTRVVDLLNPAAVLLPAANVIMQLASPSVGYGVLESPVDSGNVYKHPFKRARTTGTIEAVVYLGSVNHYVVRLDDGGTLTVLRQNLHGTSDQKVGKQGDKVALAWADEHLIQLTPSDSGTHQEEP